MAATTLTARHQMQRRRSDVVAAGAVAVAIVVLALLLLSGVSGALGADPLTHSEPPGAPSARYVVQPGDTVWSIATEHAGGADARPVVDAILEMRGSAPLQPGETIVLP